MRHVICPVCKGVCTKYGKTKAGSQRWRCAKCNQTITSKIDNGAKQLQLFLDWLFSKDSQKNMPGEGRTFRRKTAQYWDIWPLPPKNESKRDVVFVDGIYLSRKACVLICCDNEHVLGWYLCRYEHTGAWIALLSRIAEPRMVVSDGGHGFYKALKQTWPNCKHQRCVFHVFSQVRRYTTGNPKTLAGIELLALGRDLLHVKTQSEADFWTERFGLWEKKYRAFLSQMTRDENGHLRSTHERLIKARNSLNRVLKEGTLFTYLNENLRQEGQKTPSTNNRIEGGVNSQLRAVLREHRGLSVERRIKAVFWWCYMHSPRPLSETEIIKTMPTDKSIGEIYKRMTSSGKLEGTIPRWGDAIVWNELHMSSKFPTYWD